LCVTGNGIGLSISKKDIGMSKRNFRYLLFVYGAVIIAGAFVDCFTTVNVIPSDIRERGEQTHLLFMHGVPFTLQLAIAAVMAVAVLTIIGGWAGMLLLRSWGRYHYFFGILGTGQAPFCIDCIKDPRCRFPAFG